MATSFQRRAPTRSVRLPHFGDDTVPGKWLSAGGWRKGAAHIGFSNGNIHYIHVIVGPSEFIIVLVAVLKATVIVARAGITFLELTAFIVILNLVVISADFSAATTVHLASHTRPQIPITSVLPMACAQAIVVQPLIDARRCGKDVARATLQTAFEQ